MLKKLFVSLLSLIILFAIVIPGISSAQESSLGITNNNWTDDETFSNEDYDFYLDLLDNTDLNTTLSTNITDTSVEPKWIIPLFRAALSAGNYIKKMNRAGKVIKTVRTVVAKESQIFSKSHIDSGIMKLGTSRQNSIDSGIDVITRVDGNGKLKKGHNQIWTKINNQPAEIRVYVNNSGQLDSFDMFFRGKSVPKPGANLIVE